MAVAISGSINKIADAAQSTFTTSHTVPSGSDRCLVVALSIFNALPTSVVFNTTETLTLIGSINQSGEIAAMYQRVNPTVTTANIVTTFSASEECVGHAINLTDVDQSTPVDDFDSSSSASATSTSTAALAGATGGLALDVISLFNKVPTIGSGQTSRWAEDNTTVIESSYGSSEPGGASVTMSWSWTGAQIYAHFAAMFKQASAGGISIPVVYHHRQRNF